MSPARAALHSAIDLLLAFTIATAVAVTTWYHVGDGEGFKGELAVRLGGESIGLPTMGDRADLWEFTERRHFAAPDGPPTDDRLKEWFAAVPHVTNLSVDRKTETDPIAIRFLKFDTTVTVRYDRPGNLGPAGVNWQQLGYTAPADGLLAHQLGPTGEPRVRVDRCRGILWLTAVGCAHGALLIVVLGRGAVWLARGRPQSPTATTSFANKIALMLVAAVVLVGLVALHEQLVRKVVPYATARGWVWLSSLGWGDAEKVRGWIYCAFLAGPIAVQLFYRYLLVGRWVVAGKPAVGVLLAAAVVAALWLDVSLVPLGLAVGAVLGCLAWRGVPVVGLMALHALVNAVLFGFLSGGYAPPSGCDPRLIGTWESMRGPFEINVRMTFKPNGTVESQLQIPIDPDDINARSEYVATDRDHIFVRQLGKVAVAFEGEEMVLTSSEGPSAGQATRYRRVP